MNFARLIIIAVTATAALLVAACGDSNNNPAAGVGANNGTATADTGGSDQGGITVPDDTEVPAKPTPPPPPPATPPANSTPQISGTAPETAAVAQAWSFQPTLLDADGDALTVTASNLPGWLTLNSSSGLLSGTPAEGDVQTWNGIVLTVSDGSASNSLSAFSIEVLPENVADGSATLSWVPPTLRTDGSPIGEIAGYRVLFSQTSGDYNNSINITNPGITTYMVEGLTGGTWYFAIQTIDAGGLISEPSAEASLVI